ncbi:phytoene/squalene synthase family protein [Ramlibacter sp.]|uniref:phytoene/squalene synthase family protein n=1 Tax=Ramlibacter sp. TaxID=1917967 RepID=UPI003D0F6F84
MPAHPFRESADALLREVSRSFYLSVRMLPRALRAPIGLAYLLARATDTVADTASAPVERRIELLSSLGEAIASGQGSNALFADLETFAASQSHAGERRLMLRVRECLSALDATAEADAHDIRAVLSHIVHGQSLDLERPIVPDAAALREYAYLVAGSVGEFWTDLCERHLADFANRPAWQMRAFGRSFGCALQLVNIVRDAGEDLRNGRCYFPASELAAAGFEAAHFEVAAAVLADTPRFMPVWWHWQDEAAEGLADGLTYAQAVNSRRVRAAVALPAILGQRTLSRVRAAGPSALNVKVKVPRSEVRALLFRMLIGLAGRSTVRSQGSQGSQWDNRGR